jgi:hypothetical protein
MEGGGQDAEVAEDTSESKSIKRRRIDYLAAESRMTITGRKGHGA